jgi:hypothetical protein
MGRIAFGFMIAVLAVVQTSTVEAGDVYRKIATVTDPVIAPRAPDPDTLLPVARRTDPAAKPAAGRHEKPRFPALRLPPLPTWPAASR